MRDSEQRPVIVIPTNRPDQFLEWLNSWREQLKGTHLIVVYDGIIEKKLRDKWKFEGNSPLGFTYQIFDWTSIDKDLKKDAWIIPRRTDCVRSYGFLKALEHNPLFILTLDDDTRPTLNTIEDHYKILFTKLDHAVKYYNTMKDTLPRGYFFDLFDVFEDVKISHGTWIGVPDLDAHTQLTNNSMSERGSFNKGIIPQGSYYSMCGMNLAFKPEVTKYLYFGLQGQDYPIDRCGDIWAGYYASQKDVLSATGYASVYHNRASNAWTNLKKETNASELGSQFREFFCKKEDDMKYYTLHVEDVEHKDYWYKLKDAYNIWERLCDERTKIYTK